MIEKLLNFLIYLILNFKSFKIFLNDLETSMIKQTELFSTYVTYFRIKKIDTFLLLL